MTALEHEMVWRRISAGYKRMMKKAEDEHNPKEVIMAMANCFLFAESVAAEYHNAAEKTDD